MDPAKGSWKYSWVSCMGGRDSTLSKKLELDVQPGLNPSLWQGCVQAKWDLNCYAKCLPWNLLLVLCQDAPFPAYLIYTGLLRGLGLPNPLNLTSLKTCKVPKVVKLTFRNACVFGNLLTTPKPWPPSPLQSFVAYRVTKHLGSPMCTSQLRSSRTVLYLLISATTL